MTRVTIAQIAAHAKRPCLTVVKAILRAGVRLSELPKVEGEPVLDLDTANRVIASQLRRVKRMPDPDPRPTAEVAP